MEVELLIQNGDKIYAPAIEGEIVWSTERKGSPGELKFKVVKDAGLNFTEGNNVTMRVDGKGVFIGYVFTKKRDKEGIISVTAYDQLRYFKNKFFYIYENKTAKEFLRMIAEDFKFKLGTLEDTKYKIASRIEENKTLFDMMQNALDVTLQNTKEMYVLYDDFGSLALKNISSMAVNVLIDEETGENFDYTSSIDSDTYNKVIVYNEEATNPADKFKVAQDDANIARWGVLQLVETMKEGENGKAKADALLSLYNQKTRTLSISKAFGDLQVRAGCMVVVQLHLGDIKLNNYMLVEKCKHTFRESEHYMDLTLRGGEFIA